MKELRFLSGIMENFSEDGKAAIKELIHHMYDTFKLDSINLYWGANLNRAYYMGVELGGSLNADYVKTEGLRSFWMERIMLLWDSSEGRQTLHLNLEQT